MQCDTNLRRETTMAHFFDILTAICRQIDNFAKGRDSKLSKRIPDFLEVQTYRSISTIPEFVLDDQDESKTIDIDKCAILHVGQPITTIYMAIASNISKPSVDSFVNILPNLEKEGIPTSIASMALGIILPERMFDESTDIADIAYDLRQIYLGILNLDSKMHYAAEPAILRMADSSKIQIPMYDIEMMICAICCIYISLMTWFSWEKLDTIVVESFTTDELTQPVKDTLCQLFRKYKDTDSLRDAVGNGKLLKSFFMAS